MKKLAIGFAICVTLIIGGTIWFTLSSNDSRAINIGGFVILSLTLIVLVWYAYDTNSIAQITRERWSREGVLATTYQMEMVKEGPDRGKTVFRLTNSSPLVVRAKVNCNFRVYGHAIEGDACYAGKDLWVLFPHQLSQGWFDIETLLQKQGTSSAAMAAECTPHNCNQQLTMFLELEYSDELGQKRTLPGRSHYFDFLACAWIPQLTESVKS